MKIIATIAHHVPNGCTLVPVYTINHIGLNLMRDNPPILSITCDDRSVDEMSSLIKTQQAEIRRLRTELKSKNDEIGLWTQQCYSLLGCKNDLEAELLQIKVRFVVSIICQTIIFLSSVFINYNVRASANLLDVVLQKMIPVLQLIPLMSVQFVMSPEI